MLQINYQKKVEELLSTGKRKSYAVAAITVFFILLMAFAGIIPALSSLGYQHEENIKRDAIITKLQNKLDILKSFVQQNSDKKDVINFLNDMFPDKFAQKDIVDKIVELSDKNSVNIVSFGFQDPQPGEQDELDALTTGNSKILTTSITGDGTLENLESFVKDVETSRRIMNITSVVISKKAADEVNTIIDGRDFNLSLSIDFYYYSTTQSST